MRNRFYLIGKKYLKALGYIDTVTNVVSDRKYANYRKLKRKYQLDLLEGKDAQKPSYPSSKWTFDFHSFSFN